MMDNKRDDVGKRGGGDIAKWMAMRKRRYIPAYKIGRIYVIFPPEIESDGSNTHNASAAFAAVDWILNSSLHIRCKRTQTSIPRRSPGKQLRDIIKP